GYGIEWTGTAYQERKSAGLAPYIFALAIIFVFLFLAAQYESWAMPFMVILSVPLAMLGALGAVWLRGLINDVYCQIGLVMLIGLASKNAILIVEFAKVKREEGMSILDAAELAVRIRLRPILMTSLAFILGVLPLAIASGAGSASRHSLGTAVIGGMFVSTFLSLVIVPVFYFVIENIREHGLATAMAKLGPQMRWLTDMRGSLTWLYRELSGAMTEMRDIAKNRVAKPLENLSQELSIADEGEEEKSDGEPENKK
ncbi:MAG TPA: efflux RND transporter permease subunit, partial [bacterium]|nr:efflux RND transporter permease subunit [bacterium]